MVAGPQLRSFEENLGGTAPNVRDVEDEVPNVRAKVREARAALETPRRIERDADDIGDKLERLQLSLKVIDKVAVLKPISLALQKTLQTAERAADRVEGQARDLRKQIENAGWIDRLKDAEAKLVDLEQNLAATAATIDGYAESTGEAIDGFDRLGQPVKPLADATDALVEGPNRAVVSLNELFESVEDDVDDFTSLIDSANFSPVIDVGNDFAKVKELICRLEDTFGIAYPVLKPIEPLLDAVGFVFRFTVEPVLDFVLGKLGLDRVMDAVARQLERLLPDFNPLDTLQAKIEEVFGAVEDFINDAFDIDAWTARIQSELIEPLTDASDGPTGFGSKLADSLTGDAFRDILDGGGGNDTLFGGGGADALVASAGDDVLDGGAGFDAALFSGNFAEYTITQNEDGTFIVAHTTPPRGEPGTGADLLRSIAELQFADRKITTQTLRDNVKIAEAAELIGIAADEFLLGGDRAVVTIDGRGGADELYGGTGDDELRGGDGNDLLHGAAGNDVIRGGAGIDSVSYANAVPGGIRARTTSDDTPFGGVTVDLGENRADGAAGSDQIFAVENVYGSEAADTLRGDRAANALYGSGGADRLFGAAGDDVLVPGSGDDAVAGGDGHDRIVVDRGDLVASGGRGRDILDLATVRGSITVDFANDTYAARLRVDLPVWRDTGTVEARAFDGASYTPSDVLETDPTFANSADDLTRRLPRNPTDADDASSPEVRETFERFKIEAAVVTEAATGRFDSIEVVRGGSAATRLLPSVGVDRFDGRDENANRDRLDLRDAESGIDFDLRTGDSAHPLLSGDQYQGLEEVAGSALDDRISGDDTANVLVGRDGNDTLWGRGGADEIRGNEGRDALFGNKGKDLLQGGAWADRLAGGKGDDRLQGQRGDDLLEGARGNDVLRGGPGNDRLSGGPGRDSFVFRVGDDRDTVADLTASEALLLGSGLWRGNLAPADIVERFGRDAGADVVLTFGGGDEVLRIENVGRDAVIDAIEIV